MRSSYMSRCGRVGAGWAVVARGGDAARAVACGGAVRLDGRSACVTAPNGQALQARLRAATAEAVESLSSLRRLPPSW